LAKLIFWWSAWAVALLAVLSGLAGALAARQGRLELHRRRLNRAAALMALFLAAYAIKALLLGREALQLWSPWAVVLLRIHEAFIALMLGFAVRARLLAAAARRGDSPASSRAHRLSGRMAVLSSCGMFLSACGLLWHMMQLA
jgi:uncharacterized membrane protein YozB (DUF420 family)